MKYKLYEKGNNEIRRKNESIRRSNRTVQRVCKFYRYYFLSASRIILPWFSSTNQNQYALFGSNDVANDAISRTESANYMNSGLLA